MPLKMNKNLIDALLKSGLTKAQIRRIKIGDNVEGEFEALLEKVSKGEQTDLAEFKLLGESLLRGYRTKGKNLKRDGPRNRIDPKEKRFKELVPKLDLSKDWITIQAKLQDEYNLIIGRTAILEYIEKYRSR